MKRKKVFKGLFALLAALAVFCSFKGTAAYAAVEEDCYHSLEHITEHVDGTGSSSWTRTHTITIKDSDRPDITFECIYHCRVLVVNAYCDICKRIISTNYYMEEKHQNPDCPSYDFHYDFPA